MEICKWQIESYVYTQGFMGWRYMRLCCHLMGSRSLIGQKLQKITHNSMKNRGSTPILTNLVGSTQGTSTQNLKQIRAAV